MLVLILWVDVATIFLGHQANLIYSRQNFVQLPNFK